jgi:hypothetical protein
VTAVIGELRVQIETAQRGLVLAEQADLPYEAHLHRARVQDLLEIAARHGIDATGWVSGSLPTTGGDPAEGVTSGDPAQHAV